MLSHCRARHISKQSAESVHLSCQVNPTTHAQTQGFRQLSNLSTTCQMPSLPSIVIAASRSALTTPSLPNTPSASAGPLTPISPQLVALPTVTSASPSPLAVPDRTVKELEAEEQEQDLCTVKNKLHHYKEDPTLPPDAPLDLVQFWDVGGTLSFKQLSHSWILGEREDIPPSSSKLHLTFYLFRHQLSLVSTFSHRARKHVPFNRVFYLLPLWRCCKSSSISTSKNSSISHPTGLREKKTTRLSVQLKLPSMNLCRL